MHFSAAPLATVLFAASALALPTAAPDADVLPRTCTQIRPQVISTYQVWSGARQYAAPKGIISKPNGQSTDITTLATFVFDGTTAGKTCSVGFSLGSGTSSWVSGTASFDIFTSLEPAAPYSTTSWPSGNLRDQYVGRMKAVKGGEATYATDIVSEKTFPCPYNTKVGGELVGTGDFDYITWDPATEGPYISVC